jgi:hypothetical protein
MKKPLDVCDAGPIVDMLEIWMFQYGKPAAICTDEGALFGGLFRAWCGYRSIKHRICSRPRLLRSGNKRVLVPGDRQHTHEWPKALLRHFWLQRRGHTWQRGRGLLPSIDMRQEAFSCNFWLFWVWRPGLMCCKQQHSPRCLRNWGSPGDSAVFHMSDELGGRIEAAEADYKTAVEVVKNRIRDAEDNYVVVHGKLREFGESLNRFAEFLAKEMDNDVPVVPTVTAAADNSGGSIHDDPDIY